MSTVAPTVPPRPTRANEVAITRGVDKLPEIPPRPVHKRLDRSVSPGNYPRSPLNEPYNPLVKTRSLNAAAERALPRPPSVQHLPSIGQEGLEYGEIQYQPEKPSSAVAADAAAQTRNVAEDLHLHAPKPSLPKSSAVAQVQAVTRTDSSQAAAHGLGKPPTPGHDEHVSHDALERVRSRASFSRPNSSASGGRRASVVYGDETGPAELGLRVPINPLLGDVQAPSPAPTTPNHTGLNGDKRRHHNRTKSGRDPPPGSYGLHGHGVAPTDPFEKDWYSKHPDELVNEEAHGRGVYEGIGSGRGAFALSSDDLNKIVRNTSSRLAGFGTSGNIVSYPDEQIGYLASEHYVSQSQPTTPYLSKTLTNTSQPSLESPLRKASVPAIDVDPVVEVRTRRSASQQAEDAVEAGHEGPVHVDEPAHHYNKITGGEGTIDENRDTKSYAEDDDDHGYSVPILAADEVAKSTDHEHLQPAVSPRLERRSSQHEPGSGEHTPSTSRPSSRPGSIYGLHSASHSLSRFISHHDDREAMHTPLEDVDEYEPLFPDEDSKQKSLTHAERFKPRPDMFKHRFPSQDIWEDAPNSVMYQATVSTPDLPQPTETTHSENTRSAAYESLEAEAAWKGEAPTRPADDFLTRSRPHLKETEARPGLQPRFPSQDIWEDSPESYHLVATVSNTPLFDSAAAPKPVVPPRPAAKNRGADLASSSQAAPPTIPPRPQQTAQTLPPIEAKFSGSKSPPKSSPTELRKVPTIPDRPKPQIPPRPAKQTAGESLTKTLSKESADSNETEMAVPLTSPPLAKVKPQIPARPAQAKFANLKGNFMNDLNSKLGLGPPKEKEKESEPEIEAKPLEDARKGRARGPQRRAPAKSPAAAPTSTPQFSISKPQLLWNIDDTGLLNVGSTEVLPPAGSVESAEAAEAKPEAVSTLSSEKIEQLDHATIADAPLPPALDTESKADILEKDRPDDATKPITSSPANKDAEFFPDPTLGTPGTEKDNPLSTYPTATTVADGVTLSQPSTDSSEGAAKFPVERETPDPQTDAIPASKQTTASTTAASGDDLERFKTEDHVLNPERKAPEEEIELRNEQVTAPAPGMAVLTSSPAGPVGDEADVENEMKRGADAPKEPMPEEDVTYKQLEDMQSQADGKVKKIVD